MPGSGRRISPLIALLGLSLLSLWLLLPACSPSRKAAPPFELKDQFGQTASLAQLRGKVVVLTFLYTHCTDTCPLYLFRIQQAISQLGTEEVAVVAVTVDPERDTVERLRDFTSHLPPGWLYLTGEPGQLKLAWDNYDVYVEKKITEGHGSHEGYEVIHTAKVVLIDREGFLRSEVMGDWQVEELEGKLRRLLSGQEVSDFRPWQSFVNFLYRCGPVSISSMGGAIGHFLFILSIPLALFGLYRLLAR